MDLVKRGAGRHKTSPGKSKGTLMEDSVLHLLEKEEDGDMAETNAISGENEATATVRVNSAVHVAAKTRRGDGVVRPKRMKEERERDMMVGKV